jgi:hypothetical protein
MQYEIFTAHSLPQLTEHVDAGSALLWCGCGHLTRPNTCEFPVSPYQETYIGIRQPKGLLGGSGARAGRHAHFVGARRRSPGGGLGAARLPRV